MFLGELLGPDLLIVVLIGALVLFGGAAIPKLARNLGSAKSEFEKGIKEVKTQATLTDLKVAEATTTDSKTSGTDPSI